MMQASLLGYVFSNMPQMQVSQASIGIERGSLQSKKGLQAFEMLAQM